MSSSDSSFSHTSGSSLNRRGFMKAATLSGAAAAAWSGLPVTTAAAQSAGTASDSTPVPLAPPDKQPPNLKLPEKPERKVGWAVVGLGQLALEEVMPAFRECHLSRPVALVSRHPDKAKKIAEVYGIKPEAIYSYDNYDEIAKNEEVEIIYIILPNSLHAEYTIRGLKAGKHVLCEKPMAASVEECERMIAAAKEADKKLMIAYRLHYEPLNQKVMEFCKEKTFGEIKTFSSSNCQNVKAPNIRLSRELAGGPVEDVGVYCINAARYVIREEPVEAYAIAHQPKDDPRFREVPESVAFTLKFPSGVLAHCDCSFGSQTSRRYRAHCADGFIDMDPAFSYSGLKLTVSQKGEKTGAAEVAELDIPQVNHFASEMDHLSLCVLKNTAPRTPGEEGLADMKIVEAIAESVKTGVPVKIS